MTRPCCWFCGKPGEASPAGSILCPGCRERYDEYRCGLCGQCVCVPRTMPHSDLCSGCVLRARTAELTAAELDRIRTLAAAGRRLEAIRELRQFLDLSLNDAAGLVCELEKDA